MLPCQYLRRRHHHCLITASDGLIHGCLGNNCLAGPDVSLYQPVHRSSRNQISRYLINAALLRLSERIWQRIYEFLLSAVVCEPCPLSLVSLVHLRGHESRLQGHELVKNEPVLAFKIVLSLSREVHVPYSELHVRQVVPLDCLLTQNALDLPVQRLDQPLQASHLPLRYAACERVYRQNAGLYILGFFELRMDYLQPVEVDHRLSEEGELISAVDSLGQIRGIKKYNLYRACIVCDEHPQHSGLPAFAESARSYGIDMTFEESCFALLELYYIDDFFSVFVYSRKSEDEVLDSLYAKPRKSLRLFRPDAH